MRRSNRKLSYKYFGPYLILQTVSKVAYKLQLPATSQIHPVLHVSQLKKALPPDASLSKDVEMQLLLTLDTLPPSQVLAERLRSRSAYLIIRTIQLVFSAGTIFFSHNNSARTVFFSQFSQVSASQTGLTVHLGLQKLIYVNFD